MKNELIKNGKYLVKKIDSSIRLITVLNITETSYQFEYESGATVWMEKLDFDEFKIIEDVTNQIISVKFVPSNINHNNYLMCVYCNGTGLVRDTETTANYKLCIHCSGTGTIQRFILHS